MIPLGVLASSYVAQSAPAGFAFRSSGSVPNTGWATIPLDIGPASSSRVVLIALTYQGTPTDVQLGGIAPTFDVSFTGSVGATTVKIGHVALPTGTTANFTCYTDNSRLGVGVWTASGGTISAVTTGTGPSMSLAGVLAGDFVVAARYSVVSTTWSGGVTNRYDRAFIGVADYHSAADLLAAANGTVSPRFSGGYADTGAAAVAYRLTV